MAAMGSDDIEKVQENPEGKMKIGEALRPGLYLIATPIGNLRDITLRALDVLAAADIILCEDTRVTRKLLAAHQIKGGRLVSCNDHSEEARIEEVIAKVGEGKVVALVSDAGMPLISDPGYKMVRACYDAGIYVTSLPGANAPLSALQLSAFPSDSFCFIGFLPYKTKARKAYLEKWKEVPATLIAFESANRLIDSLRDIDAALGLRHVAVVREITKMYEEVRRGSAAELATYYEESGRPKGEVVLVIAPPDNDGSGYSDEEIEAMLREALGSMRTKEAAAFIAEKVGRKKSELYDLALRLGS